MWSLRSTSSASSQSITSARCAQDLVASPEGSTFQRGSNPAAINEAPTVSPQAAWTFASVTIGTRCLRSMAPHWAATFASRPGATRTS